MPEVRKDSVISFIKKKYTISNEDASLVLDSFLEVMFVLAQEEGGVLLKNLGRFEFQKKTLAKNIRDFRYKSSKVIECKSVRVHFYPSKNLKVKVF